jgi:hypothetical protein
LKYLLVLGILALIVLLWATACGSPGALLSGVTIAPNTISPNADGQDDVAIINYQLARPAALSIYLVDAKGEKHYFRQNERRSAGKYEARFYGLIEQAVTLGPGLGINAGQVLPNGTYTIAVEAADEQGERQQVTGQLTIVEADTTMPTLRQFSVFTPLIGRERPAGQAGKVIFTPNRDGISDRIVVSYYLEKDATVSVYLVNPNDSAHPSATLRASPKYPLPMTLMGRENPATAIYLQQGHYEHEYEGGVDLGNTPPPDGDYLVVGEATDKVGNHTVVTAPLAIAEGGVPLAEIVATRFEPVAVPMGGLLRVEITVRNIGPVPIRSKGPYSGTIYANDQNFNSISVLNDPQKDFFEEPGVFRVGVDYEGNSAGREYPYRWGFSGDKLMPGEQQTVVGYIRMVEKTKPHNPYFWAGLLHEQVRKVNDKSGPRQITIEW